MSTVGNIGYVYDGSAISKKFFGFSIIDKIYFIQTFTDGCLEK